MTRTARTGSLVLLVTFTLGACSALEEHKEEETDGGPVALYDPLGEGGAAALLAGTLSEEDGCVVVTPTEGDGPVVPLLPSPASWSAAGLDFRDDTYAEGSEVSMGGGMTDTPPEKSYVPEACADLPMFVVHQETTTLTE